MKIQVGTIEINKNKTWKYLLPCLKAYGQDFVDRINTVFKVAVGIGDMLLIKSGVRYEQHIFILVDMEKFPAFSKKFINWLRDQPMYEDDYAFDHIHEGKLQMLVIKLPEECYKPAEQFKRSHFSKMYTLSQIEKFFNKKPEIQKILIKDHNYRIEYAQELNQLFDTSIEPEELEGELEFPIRKSAEFFNLLKEELNDSQTME